MHGRLVLLGFLVLAACIEEDEPPPIPTCTDPSTKPLISDVPLVRESEHLDIYSPGFVCLGTAVELERHVSFVADALGVDLRTGIPVVLSETPPEACQGISDSEVLAGCSKSYGSVFTMPRAVYHELNHSVACQLRSGTRVPAVVEGLAVMFEPQTPTKSWLDEGEQTLLELLESDYPYVDYTTSGHFSRWLFERDGVDTFVELYRMQGSTDDISALLAKLYATEFDELEAQYRSEAPWTWVPFRQCADLPHVSRNADGEWRFASVMDCDDASTHGPYIRDAMLWVDDWNTMYQSFTFTLDTDLTLDFTLAGTEEVLLYRCPEASPLVEDYSVFDKGLLVPGAIPTLTAGTWRADVLTSHGPPVPVEVALWERPG